MSYLLIDGYNLIGTAHSSLEKARSEIIEKLRTYSKFKGHNITIVFDGWKSGGKDESKITSANMTVIFTRLGDTADYVIQKMLSSTSRPWIVVSSDMEVYDYAVKNNFAAVTSEEFERRLNAALGRKAFESEMTDDEIEEELIMNEHDNSRSSPHMKGGNPRKLSKKQKIKLQALKKL